MTTTTDAEIQQLVGPQLVALADALAVQPTGVADRPSLCAGWAVRHVLAHMTMAARYDAAAFSAELEAAGYDFEALSETIARRDGEVPFEALLADLRSAVLAAWAPPGGGALGALSHAVIHGLDITEAVGLVRTCSDAAAGLVLEALSAHGVASRFGVDPAGYLLRATDLAWEHGDGPPIVTSAGELILALAGRPRPGVPLRPTAG